MADNVTFQTTVATPPNGTVVAADDVSSVLYQRVKLDLGGDGVASPLVRGQQADANSIPVTLSSELATVLAAIQTAVEVIDNIVSGSEAQVDVVSSALPTGAATAAKQPALGTAGTASADVITVQGIASMTALTVDGSGVTQPVSASSLPLPTGASTLAEQQTQTTALQVMDDWDESDRAKVNLIVGQAGIAAGAGAVGVTVPRVTLASDDPAVTALQIIDNAISGSEMQVDVVGSLPAGTNAIGKLAANSGVDIGDVDVLSIAAGANAIGNVGIIPRASGGMSNFRSIDLDETEEEVKASAGQVFSIAAFNTTAAPLYLKFYNATAANVTVGTTAPALTFVIPGNADSDGAGFIWNNVMGFAFGTAISVACTTGVADNDTGAPGANACIVNIGYA